VSTIFTFVVSNGVSSSDPFEFEVQGPRYQISLGAVCKAWRHIVRSTPQLWTSIRIRLQSDFPQLEILRLFLQLSCSLPLHIQATSPSRYKPTQEDWPMLSSVLEMLNDHSERWKTLEIHLIPRLLALIRGVSPGAPTLEHLRIRIFGTRTTSAFQLSFGLPSPRIVDVDGVLFSSTGINWKNVTKLNFGTLSYGECFSLFQQAVHLVECQIKVLRPGDPDMAGPFGVISVPCLALLQVHFVDNPSAFLERVILPSLERFEPRGGGPFDGLEHLFNRSSTVCSLCSLTFCWAIFNGDIISILRETLLLESLVFIHVQSYGPDELNELFAMLVRTKLVSNLSQDASLIFLPHLEALCFFGTEEYPWHLVSFLFPPSQQPPLTRYRPLQLLMFNLSFEDYPHDYFDKGLTAQLLAVQRQKCTLIIRNETDDADLLRLSRIHHFGTDQGGSGSEDGEETDGEGSDSENGEETDEGGSDSEDGEETDEERSVSEDDEH